MSRLHDASACARDHHETCLSDFAPEFHSLLVLNSRWLRARRTENRDFATLRIGRKQFERVTQFPNRRLNNSNISRIFNIRQQFERALDDVRYIILVKTSAFVVNEILNPPLQFGIHRRLFRFDHADKNMKIALKSNSLQGRAAPEHVRPSLISRMCPSLNLLRGFSGETSSRIVSMNSVKNPRCVPGNLITNKYCPTGKLLVHFPNNFQPAVRLDFTNGSPVNKNHRLAVG